MDDVRLVIDYAPTQGITCHRCRFVIQRDHLRVTKQVRNAPAVCFHYQCHQKEESGYERTDIDEYTGLKRLAWKDMMRVAGDAGHETPSIQGLKEQHTCRLALAAELHRSKKDGLRTEDLVQICTSNGLFVPNGRTRGVSSREELCYRIADALLFGVFPPCPVCRKGGLYQEVNDVHCCGTVGGNACNFQFRYFSLFQSEKALGRFDLAAPDVAQRIRRCRRLVLTKKLGPGKWPCGLKEDTTVGLGGGGTEAGWSALDSDDEGPDGDTGTDSLRGFIFCIPEPVQQRLKGLDEDITGNSGARVGKINVDGTQQRPTHVIADTFLPRTHPDLEEARKLGIPVVSPDFIRAKLRTRDIPRGAAAVLVRGRQPGKPNGNINGRYVAEEGRPNYYVCGTLVLSLAPDGRWRIGPAEGHGAGGSLARARPVAVDVFKHVARPESATPVLPLEWEVYDGARFRFDPEVVSISISETRPTGAKLWQRKWAAAYMMAGFSCGPAMQAPRAATLKRRLVRPAPGSAALVVHEGFKCDEEAEIYVDSNNHVYNVTLTKIEEGIHKYSVLQLICHGMNSYSIFRRWGNLGGKEDSFPHSFNEDLEAAVEAFEDRFLNLTGQEFKQEEEFVEIGGKFAVQAFESQQPRKRARVEKEVSKTLPYIMQHFVDLLFDESMVEAELEALAVDVEKLPLGLLSEDHVEQAYAALGRAGAELEAGAGESPLAVERVQRLREHTEEFYKQIPHVLSKAAAPEVVDSVEKLALLTQRVADLRQVTAFRAKSNDAKRLKTNDESLVDAQYAVLAVPLSPVPKEARSYLLVKNALETTHDPTQRFTLQLVDLLQYPVRPRVPHAGTRRLLWLGARLSSWVGLISEGLQAIMPLDLEPAACFPFGRGLRFSDAVAGSAAACAATPAQDEGLLVLCEVELGELKEVVRADQGVAGEGSDSVVALGRTAPKDLKPLHVDILHEDNGVEVALGPLQESARAQELAGAQGRLDRQYNEYVVANLARVHPRFLARVKFTFAGEPAAS